MTSPVAVRTAAAAQGTVEAAAAADEGAVVMVPLAIVFVIAVATVMSAGSLLWLFFGIEALLTVAVETAFGYAAMRATRSVIREGWLTAAVRLTWKPMLGTLVLAVSLGALLDRWVPQARSLPEAIRILASDR